MEKGEMLKSTSVLSVKNYLLQNLAETLHARPTCKKWDWLEGVDELVGEKERRGSWFVRESESLSGNRKCPERNIAGLTPKEGQVKAAKQSRAEKKTGGVSSIEWETRRNYEQEKKEKKSMPDLN